MYCHLWAGWQKYTFCVTGTLVFSYKVLIGELVTLVRAFFIEQIDAKAMPFPECILLCSVIYWYPLKIFYWCLIWLLWSNNFSINHLLIVKLLLLLDFQVSDYFLKFSLAIQLNFCSITHSIESWFPSSLSGISQYFNIRLPRNKH